MEFKSLLLIRPYSLLSFGLIGLIVNLLIRRELLIDFYLFLDIFAPMCLWSANMLFSEAVQKDKKGFSKFLFFIFMSVFLVIVIYREILAILILVIGFLLSFAYSIKKKNTIFSPFSFIFRGFKEVLLFAIIAMFYLHDFNSVFLFISENWLFVSSIYLITISRNLVGDLRDFKFDKYTFPKKFGKKSSVFVASFLILAVFFLLQNILLVFPILISAFFIMLPDYYLAHKIFVISTMAFLFNFVFLLLNYSLFLSNLIFIGVLLNLTYDYVPRNSNKELLKGFTND